MSSDRQELDVVQGTNHRGGGANGKASESPLGWLVKAKPEEIVEWLASRTPSGSKIEALAAVQRLENEIREQVPQAVTALGMVHKLAKALETMPDGRPLISPPGDLLAVTAQTWDTLLKWCKPDDPRRFLARFGDAIVWLERNDDGALGTCPIDTPRMINLLARIARWGSVDRHTALLMLLLGDRLNDTSEEELLASAAKQVTPPASVATNILVGQERPLPMLERVVEAPVLAPDGSIHDKRGYDHSSRSFYQPCRGLKVPPISKNPAGRDIAEARSLILDHLLCDFPFVVTKNDGADVHAERAHAVACLLEQFARVAIKGHAPLYLIEAPTPGTGKTLLVEGVAAPILGARPLTKMSAPRDEDEWRKQLTAKLRTSPPFLVIDNVGNKLDSSALAMMVTAGVIEDRLLGVSQMVRLPVRCTVIVTGNNVVLSDEMARRVVRVRLDSGVEAPEDREGFTHELPSWAVENRGELIWAVLTLCRAWVNCRCPAGPEKPLGSFESWTKVIGGILHVAEIPGLLGNVKEVRAHTRDTDHAELLQALSRAMPDVEFTARDVASDEGVRGCLSVPDNAVAGSVARKLGYRLRSIVDRPIAGVVLRRAGEAHRGVSRWRVELTGQGAAYGSSPPSPPQPAKPMATGDTAGGDARQTGGDHGAAHHPLPDASASPPHHHSITSGENPVVTRFGGDGGHGGHKTYSQQEPGF
jgi:hypothetical protein